MRVLGKEREGKLKFLRRIELLLTLGQVKLGTANSYLLHKITSLNDLGPSQSKSVHFTSQYL